MQGFLDVPASNYTAAALIQYGWTQRQSEAAEVDPTDWTVRQADGEIVFNSAPQMSVKNVTMEITGAERDVLFKVEYENTGDVEVTPAGVLVVRDSSDEKFIEVTRAGEIEDPRLFVDVNHVIAICPVSETSGNAKSAMILADDEEYRVIETVEEVQGKIKEAQRKQALSDRMPIMD